MNKNLLFLLLLTTLFQFSTHPWFEHPLTNYVRSWWLKRQEQKTAAGYMQQNIKNKSSAQPISQVADPKEEFQKVLYGKIVDANNKWGLVEDFFHYRQHFDRKKLPPHATISKDMANKADQFYDLIENYQMNLSLHCIFESCFNEEQKKINCARKKLDDFKQNANFYELTTILESIKFAKNFEPYNFDKKYDEFLKYLRAYLGYEISHYYLSFYQCDQFSS